MLYLAILGFSLIFFAIIYINRENILFPFKTPKVIIQKYGNPINAFWISMLYSPLKKDIARSVNVHFENIYIAIYEKFVVIKGYKFEVQLYKENIVQFEKPKFLKNCSLKIKTQDVSENIELTFISKKQIKQIEDFLIRNNDK